MIDFEDQIRIARRTDLGDYLAANHPEDVVINGNCIHLREHDSIYTRFGYCGYTRFSSMETGNSIDCLVRYLAYPFRNAVTELVSKGRIVPLNAPSKPQTENTFVLPKPANKPYTRVFAYLYQQRCIPADTIQRLFQENLLYQEVKTGNAVFLSRDSSFCELRGTNPLSQQAFHGIRRRHPACFWSVKNLPSGTVRNAFICESAIDAVSLMVLHEKSEFCEPSAYVSIGGVRNQQAINRISASVHTIIAVDNDQAGQECRDRNPMLDSRIPVFKDWNEDLQHLIHP